MIRLQGKSCLSLHYCGVDPTPSTYLDCGLTFRDVPYPLAAKLPVVEPEIIVYS